MNDLKINDMLTPEITTVLFDCDGTLVNSEILAMGHLAKAVTKQAHGQGFTSVSEEQILKMFGLSFPEMSKILCETYQGLSFPENFHDPIRKKTLELLGRETEPAQGVSSFIDACLEGGRDIAIVTTSKRDRVYAALECSGIRRYFGNEIIYSAASDLPKGRGKPNPDIYLTACDDLGIKPEQAITFEDSASGVESAQRAGIRVYGYVGADHILDKASHSELLLDKGAAAVFGAWSKLL